MYNYFSTAKMTDLKKYTPIANYRNIALFVKNKGKIAATAEPEIKVLFIRGTDERISLPSVFVRPGEDIYDSSERLFTRVLKELGSKDPKKMHLLHHKENNTPYIVNIIETDMKIMEADGKPGDVIWVSFPLKANFTEHIEFWALEVVASLLSGEKK